MDRQPRASRRGAKGVVHTRPRYLWSSGNFQGINVRGRQAAPRETAAASGEAAGCGPWDDVGRPASGSVAFWDLSRRARRYAASEVWGRALLGFPSSFAGRPRNSRRTSSNRPCNAL